MRIYFFTALYVFLSSMITYAQDNPIDYPANVLTTKTISSTLDGLKKDHNATCLDAKSRKNEIIYENSEKNISVKNSKLEIYCYGCNKYDREVEFLVEIQSETTQQMIENNLDVSVWIKSINIYQAVDTYRTNLNGCKK